MRTITKGEKFLDVMAVDEDTPIFSEEYLYARMQKTDARFVLGIAEEYEALIDLLGVDKIRELLAKAEKKDG